MRVEKALDQLAGLTSNPERDEIRKILDDVWEEAYLEGVARLFESPENREVQYAPGYHKGGRLRLFHSYLNESFDTPAEAEAWMNDTDSPAFYPDLAIYEIRPVISPEKPWSRPNTEDVV